MNIKEIKAQIFDAEQSITFARECIEENDREGLSVALHGAVTELTVAVESVDAALLNARERTS